MTSRMEVKDLCPKSTSSSAGNSGIQLILRMDLPSRTLRTCKQKECWSSSSDPISEKVYQSHGDNGQYHLQGIVW